MNFATPQLSPDEYAMTKSESVISPEFEPGTDAGKTVGKIEIVAPDIEPPASIGESEEQLASHEDTTELVAPEFSPSSVGIVESKEDLIAPQEVPPPQAHY